MTVRVDFVAHAPVEDAVIELFVYTTIGGRYGPWCQLTTAAANGDGMPLDAGPGAVEFDIEELGLLPATCHMNARIAHAGQPAGYAIDWQPECLALRIDPGRSVRGSFYMAHRWRAMDGRAVHIGPHGARNRRPHAESFRGAP
jgi:hypothetical protein